MYTFCISYFKQLFITSLLLLFVGLTQAQNYQDQLDDLNDYLKKFNSGYYEDVSVNGKLVTIKAKGGYASVFNINDCDGAEAVPDSKCVSIRCKNDAKCMIEQSYDGQWPSYTFIENKRAPFNYPKLANLLNAFLFSLKGEPIPAKYIYSVEEENKVSEELVKLVEEANAIKTKPELEQAVFYLRSFLIDKPYGNDYFLDASLIEGSLKLKSLKGRYEEIRLGLLNELTITEESPTKFTISISSKGGQCYYNTWNDYYFDNNSWDKFNEKDAKSFYVLLGNVVDAYKKLHVKNYKVTKTCEEKIKRLNDTNYVKMIDEKSIVLIEGVEKDDPNYKKIKPYIGKELETGGLFLNADMETYEGFFYGDYGKSIYVKKLRVKFIKDKQGNGVVAYKNRLKKEKAEKEMPLPAAPRFSSVQEELEYRLDSLVTVVAKDKIYKVVKADLEKQGFKYIDSGSDNSTVSGKNIESYGTRFSVQLNKEYKVVFIGKDVTDVSAKLNNKVMEIPSNSAENGYSVVKNLQQDPISKISFGIVNFKIYTSKVKNNKVAAYSSGTSFQYVDVYLFEK